MSSDPVQKRTLEQAVGEMTVIWNHCQSMVFSIFFHSLGVALPQAQSVFFSIPSDKQQRTAVRRLLESLPSNFSERADDAIEELGDLSGLRNAFIHAIWDFSKGPAGASWLDVWTKRLGPGEPIAKCDKLIGDLEKVLAKLTALEVECRTRQPVAQGASLSLALPVLPSRQAAALGATMAIQAQQQPSAQSVPPQQQPSDQR
jgi:hypothetical protein